MFKDLFSKYVLLQSEELSLQTEFESVDLRIWPEKFQKLMKILWLFKLPMSKFIYLF